MTDAQTLAKTPGSTRGPSLETIGMTKNFGRFTALDNVSVNVPAGTFHALSDDRQMAGYVVELAAGGIKLRDGT